MPRDPGGLRPGAPADAQSKDAQVLQAQLRGTVGPPRRRLRNPRMGRAEGMWLISRSPTCLAECFRGSISLNFHSSPATQTALLLCVLHREETEAERGDGESGSGSAGLCIQAAAGANICSNRGVLTREGPPLNRGPHLFFHSRVQSPLQAKLHRRASETRHQGGQAWRGWGSGGSRKGDELCSKEHLSWQSRETVPRPIPRSRRQRDCEVSRRKGLAQGHLSEDSPATPPSIPCSLGSAR